MPLLAVACVLLVVLVLAMSHRGHRVVHWGFRLPLCVFALFLPLGFVVFAITGDGLGLSLLGFAMYIAVITMPAALSREFAGGRIGGILYLKNVESGVTMTALLMAGIVAVLAFIDLSMVHSLSFLFWIKCELLILLSWLLPFVTLRTLLDALRGKKKTKRSSSVVM